MIELLAPAKDKICAKAAIDFGADAIYIGASEFGARKNVPNSLSDIKEIVEYAHQFSVKVYVALNTILTDEELERAKELIEKLKEIDVDAIIIQDMGLLKEGKKARGHEGKGIKISDSSVLPMRHCEEGQSPDAAIQEITFHASTQCDNRTVEKIKFLESVGFQRVILARELSIEQIKEIKSQTEVELEAFIHGALCVSYSGQCYLSEMIGGRSANRGECAQPCRKKYSLLDEDGNYIAKDKHLLCLKDFNASKHLKELADAGVTSFKIEGRLKDENYVKNVVGYYRKLIDDLGLGKTSSGRVLFDFEPDLGKSFNRGFTNYYLDGKRKDVFTFDSPKSKGEYIGKVSKVGQNYFELSPKTINPEIHAQDGLCFYDNEELSGCLVNKIDEVEAFRSGVFGKVQKIFPNKMNGIKVGTQIYRNSDVEFEKQLKNSKTCRKIVVNIEFELGKIKAIDEDNNSVQIKYEFEELAKTPEKMGENIINQLKKSGDTIFVVDDVKIKTDKMPFLPVSKLNELRRELFDMLVNQRLMTPHPEFLKLVPRFEIRPLRQGARVSTLALDYKANILNKSAKEFYEKLGFEVTEMALESGKVPKTGKVAMTCKHCLKNAFNMCPKSKVGIPAHQQLFLVDEKGKKYPLKFDCNKCEMEIIF